MQIYEEHETMLSAITRENMLYGASVSCGHHFIPSKGLETCLCLPTFSRTNILPETFPCGAEEGQRESTFTIATEQTLTLCFVFLLTPHRSFNRLRSYRTFLPNDYDLEGTFLIHNPSSLSSVIESRFAYKYFWLTLLILHGVGYSVDTIIRRYGLLFDVF